MKFILLIIYLFSFCEKNSSVFRKITCENHCRKHHFHRAPCEKFAKLTPEQILDTIDSNSLQISSKNSKCCCFSKPGIFHLKKNEEISLNFEPNSSNFSENSNKLNALYRPPIKNGFDKDLIVKTRIRNPLKFFENNNKSIHEDEFSRSEITKEKDLFVIKTQLKTENISKMIERNNNGEFVISKEIQDGSFINKNRLWN